jgi:hypothetical protein
MTALPAGATRRTEAVLAEHQVVLFLVRHHIGVSCTCMGGHGDGRGRKLIASRPLFPAAEALAAWRAWHAESGVAL